MAPSSQLLSDVLIFYLLHMKSNSATLSEYSTFIVLITSRGVTVTAGNAETEAKTYITE
jgi:hypothetical protein